jgi:hypothetical protein
LASLQGTKLGLKLIDPQEWRKATEDDMRGLMNVVSVALTFRADKGLGNRSDPVTRSADETIVEDAPHCLQRKLWQLELGGVADGESDPAGSDI